MRRPSKYFIYFLVVISFLVLSVSSIFAAQKTNSQEVLKRLEILETRRGEEEENFQMGVGLSDELRDGYLKLEKDFPKMIDIVAWCEYRIAEYEYSRDQFKEALSRLEDIQKKYKKTDIAIEAKILAAEIIESPYNPKRNPSAAENILNNAEQETGGDDRLAVANIAFRTGEQMEKRNLRAIKGMVHNTKAKKFEKKTTVDSPISREIKKKHNENLAKVYRFSAFANASEGKYTEAYNELSKLVNDYTGENPYNFFTETSTLEDIEYQKALALAAQGKKNEAIVELKAFIKKYPESHLSIRAQEKIEQMNPQPTISPKTTTEKLQKTENTIKIDTTCGPAALQMALSKFGHTVSLDKLVKTAGTNEEGTTMSGLIAASQQEGVQAYGMEISKSELPKATLPAILLLHDHYVTITAISGEEVTMYDPLVGWINKTTADLEALWDGKLILFGNTEVEVSQNLSTVRALSEDERQQLTGQYLCGNQGGNPGCNSAPCVNYEKSSSEADGEMDGMVFTNERVRGNNNIQTASLLFGGNDNVHIKFPLYYNSQASTTDSPFGSGWQANYSDHVKLINGNIQWITSDGSRLMYSRNIDGTFTAPPGRFESITQHNDGTITISKKNLEQWRFNDKGLLISKLDSNEKGVLLKYNEQGNLVQIADTNGMTMSVSYGENGKVASLQSGEQTVKFTYDNAKYLTKIEFPDKRSISYDYSSTFLSSVTDTHGKQTRFEYNNYGQLTAKVNAEGKRATFSSSFTNYAGVSNTYTWDEKQRITKVTDPLNGETKYTYTPDNKISTVVTALGNKTQYSYDAFGNRVSIVDALGNKTFYTYNDKGQVTSVTDALGRISKYTYDSKGNLLTITNPVGKSMTYSYDERGNLLSVIDFAGAIYRYEYDSQGWLLRESNPLGNTITYEYDSLGNRIEMTNTLGQKTKYAYDFYGHVIQITYSDGLSETMQYEGQRLVSKKDKKGNITSYRYDDLGRLLSMTTPSGATTSYSYDEQGRLVTAKDPKGNVTTKTYDAKGRTVKVSYPGGQLEAYAYDAEDRMISKIELGGNTVKYTYDAVGHVIKMERK